MITGKPKRSYIALKRITSLFEGKPFLIESDLLPVSKDSFISNATWAVAVNNKDTITALIASRSESGKDVDIIIPTNWINDDAQPVKAKLEIASGILPENDTDKSGKIEFLTLDSKDVLIKKGILKYRFKLSQCTTIRLTRIDDKKIETARKIKLSSKTRKLKAESVKFRITTKRPSSTNIRYILRADEGLVKITGTGIEQKEANATKAAISKVKNVVPWDTKSIYLSIAFPESKEQTIGTARIFIAQMPETFDNFSFWMYPRSEEKKDSVALSLYLSSTLDKKGKILKCRLKTNQWQRIKIPQNKYKFPYWNSILIVADSQSPDYKEGNKVTFEFNGFCALAQAGNNFYKRIILSRKPGGQIKSLRMIFLGTPGAQGEYRYSFDQPIEFESLDLLTEADKKYTPGLTYLKDAQLLGIKIKFPCDQSKTHSPEFISILTEKERKMISEKGLAAIGIEFVLQK